MPREKAWEADKGGLEQKLIREEERRLELEGEVRSLKAAVEDAKTNSEQVEAMSRYTK